MVQEWSIQDIARWAGTTSRTLRHYDAIGLLSPSRIGDNGYRYYDEAALVRLQRILLLRELGLGLPEIAKVLRGQQDAVAALRGHLPMLLRERDRIDRQIEAVSTTIRRLEGGEPLMAQESLAGFDHTRYHDEVIERWGEAAYSRGEQWWQALSADQRSAFAREHDDIAASFGRANAEGRPASSAEAQELAGRHYAWVTAAWQDQRPTAEQYAGLGQMYVDDARFTETYDRHGTGTAMYVRDALTVYAERNL